MCLFSITADPHAIHIGLFDVCASAADSHHTRPERIRSGDYESRDRQKAQHIWFKGVRLRDLLVRL